MKKIKYIIISLIAFSSCNYLEIEPIGKVIPHKVTEFRALLTKAYETYPRQNSGALRVLLTDEVDTFVSTAFFGDEGTAYSYMYTWSYVNPQMKEFEWQKYYSTAFYCNATIDGVMGAEVDTNTDAKEQIIAEAYALRAYAHFNLVNMYAKWYDPQTAATDRGIPLSIHIDIEQAYTPVSVGRVYEQIKSDLAAARNAIKEAGTKAVDKQAVGTNYRFSRLAVDAFEARVDLYMGNWEGAYTLAKSLIADCPLQNLNGATAAQYPWVSTSAEAIFALDRPFNDGTGDLKNACIISQKNIVYSDNDLRKELNLKFEEDRMTGEITGPYIMRNADDRTSIRSSEIYLIAAEAALKMPSPNITDARQYLGEVQANRFKVGLVPDISAMSSDELLVEIANERGREFLMEGHRWFDLRRTTRPNISKTYNGATYNIRPNDYIVPFPRSAVAANPELSK